MYYHSSYVVAPIMGASIFGMCFLNSFIQLLEK